MAATTAAEAAMPRRPDYRARFHLERVRFWQQHVEEWSRSPPPQQQQQMQQRTMTTTTTTMTTMEALMGMYAALMAQPRPEGREELIAQCQRLEVLHSLMKSMSSSAPGARAAIVRERIAASDAGSRAPPLRADGATTAAAAAATTTMRPLWNNLDEDEEDEEGGGDGRAAPAAAAASGGSRFYPADHLPSEGDNDRADGPRWHSRPLLPPLREQQQHRSFSPPEQRRSPPPQARPAATYADAAAAAMAEWTPTDVPTSEVSPGSLADRGMYSGTTASSVPTSELFARQDLRLGAGVQRAPFSLEGSDDASSLSPAAGAAPPGRRPVLETPSTDGWDLRSTSDEASGGGRHPPWAAADLTPASDYTVATEDSSSSSLFAFLDFGRGRAGAGADLLAGRYKELPRRPAHFETPARAAAPRPPLVPRPAVATAPAGASGRGPRPGSAAAAPTTADDALSLATPTVASSGAERVSLEDLRRFLYRAGSASASGADSDVSSVETLYAEWRSRYRHIVATMESTHR